MPMTDMLVDGAAHNQMLSFMDGNAGYNQIMVAEEDIHKTAFMCPGNIGTFEYVVMPFGLRNAGATYQRAMNSIFHDMIGHSLEVYIDDIVIKSPKKGNHVSNMKKAFLRIRQHKLKMNPKKCIFGVQVGNFLGFLVHQRDGKNNTRRLLRKSSATSRVRQFCLHQRRVDHSNYMSLHQKYLTEMERKYYAIERYVPQKAFKGQAIADFLANHPREEIENINSKDIANADMLGKKSLPSILTRGMEIDINSAIMTEEDWRLPIISYLQHPILPYEKKIRIMALNYRM
ncbi:hypothetical protein L3X38_011114 [Prunus dulcis]|uniref:Reverse transcriptase domain-containing protein n=1 Tax=Prunus dulcis TaxID=3755 RepID=A0AAD4ZFE4_PRUDU|nr:hypothetical protein L3X38_011114 [Prunus dulcis]